MTGQLHREVLSDLSTQRFQDNVAKKLDKKSMPIGCIGATPTSLGNNTWNVKHNLGQEPTGFIILTQGSAMSIKASMVESNGTSVTISFASDPTSFTIFLF